MLGPDVAPRHQIANPATPTGVATADLSRLLGSHLVVTTRLGSTAGRVAAVGTVDGAWPYLEVAGLLLYLRPGDVLYQSRQTYPAGFPRTVPAEAGPHPETGGLLPHVERWCPVCGAFAPATPGPQETGFWTGHAHLDPEHLTVATSGGNTAVLHSTDAVAFAACWLSGYPGDVRVALDSCTCTCQDRP